MKQPLGTYLKNKRENAGLSQKDVADHLGLSSPQYISNFERGVCGPSLETVKELCSIYKINKREIVDIMIEDYRTLVESKVLSKRKAR
ncbi:MAG: helix-turn-helix transcriptional regulator [Bdellovibrionales bacterium]|nr:helix-turn-helix transcriptional regulator [Bdellovibrionales bacterium]